MEKTFKIGQINILNREEGREDRLLRLGRHAQVHELPILAVQEIVEPEITAKIMHDAGYPHFYIAVPDDFELAHGSMVGVFSQAPLQEARSIKFPQIIQRDAALASLNIDGRNIHVMSAHFAWGGDAEHRRLRQAEILDEIARGLMEADPNSTVLLCGDLNAEPDYRTIRFLTGKDLGTNNNSTYWTDAWKVAGKSDDYATTDQGQGYWGPQTAKRQNIKRPYLLPARRIDYILTHGWAYGKPGCAVDFGRFGFPLEGEEIELSDHYGIWAEILL